MGFSTLRFSQEWDSPIVYFQNVLESRSSASSKPAPQPHYIPNPAVRDLWRTKNQCGHFGPLTAIPPVCVLWCLSCLQICVCITTLVLPSPVLSLSAPLCVILHRSAHSSCLWPEQPCPPLQYSSRYCLITHRILFQLQFPVLARSSDGKHWLRFPYSNESCFPFPELWTWAERPRMTIWCGHCGMPFIPGSFTDLYWEDRNEVKMSLLWGSWVCVWGDAELQSHKEFKVAPGIATVSSEGEGRSLLRPFVLFGALMVGACWGSMERGRQLWKGFTFWVCALVKSS